MTLPTFLLCSMTITLPSLKPQPPVPPVVDFELVAEAIRQAENTPLYAPLGPAKERGVYQITPDVWVRYSSAPHAWASSGSQVHRDETHRVAVAHVKALAVELRAAGVVPTPYSLALAWGAGATATIQRSAPARKRDYAARASNLYHALRR